MTQPTDSELVLATRSGSEEAFRELVLRYQRPVFSLILRMVRDRSLAEDLSQEAFVKAYRALGRFDPSRKFSSWLFKIAHNLTIDSIRRKRLHTQSLDQPIGSADGDLRLGDRIADHDQMAPDRAVESVDLGESLERAIAALRPEYREVVMLRFVEEMSYQEVAEILDLPLGTIKTYIHRARKELAELLGGEGWDRDA